MSVPESNDDVEMVSRAEFWDERYRTNSAGWDLGTPTPVFEELLNRSILPERARTLVLGSGYGHDARLFAQHGYSVLAIDISATAIEEAKRLTPRTMSNVHFLKADLFSLGKHFKDSFDLVVEYVTLCAVDPRRRGEFISTVRTVLKKGGMFVALLFPVDGRPGGPPFAVDEDEVNRLLGQGFAQIHRSIPASSVKPRRGKEVLTIWKKI